MCEALVKRASDVLTKNHGNAVTVLAQATFDPAAELAYLFPHHIRYLHHLLRLAVQSTRI